jgi:hypothetical protein
MSRYIMCMGWFHRQKDPMHRILILKQGFGTFPMREMLTHECQMISLYRMKMPASTISTKFSEALPSYVKVLAWFEAYGTSFRP